MKILILDDDKNALMLMKKHLTMNGDEVYIFDDPAKAIYSLHNDTFDLMILDYMMPNIDGLTVLEILEDGEKQIPTIISTAVSDKDVIKQFFRHPSVVDYSVKPDINDLLFKIKRYQHKKVKSDLTHQIIKQDLEILRSKVIE